ncbi:hypothetical protein ACWDBP_44380 [Streptomyces sp. NPDC001233]|uniref:Uncharacterized protein n=1 Tax=Streptomyces roseochromogenus subsp. oscitans DS 12.976 TaxID=1352936 RepID=V6K5H9_STRRC|nr:hypothetical protein [Streptomyces roseochromogenus]EST27387.1 hypothetical protein M878_25655 [Streptomyces roseochromogenus subsp. oscitans DS 12.976]
MSVPPSAEPTLWELHRAVSQLREDLRGDLARLAARLDHVVTEDVYRADQRAFDQRISQIEAGLAGLRDEHDQATERAEQQRREDQAQAAATRRLVLSSFVSPLLLMTLQLWLASRGAAP